VENTNCKNTSNGYSSLSNRGLDLHMDKKPSNC